MAHLLADRVRETTTSTGTGTIALAGAYSATTRTFASVYSVGDTFPYSIVARTGSDWETGIGTYTALNTITRTTITASSNAGSAVNFSAGTKDVFVGPIASTLGLATVPTTKGGTGLTTIGTANQVLAVNGSASALEYQTITSNPGTVTSVSGSGTINGITLSGTVTSSGSLTLGGALSSVSLTTQVTGTLPVANGGTGVTTSTGTGSVVLSTAPTLTTPLTNSISAVPVGSGAGNNLTITAGNGVTSGAGGNIILQPGAQATTGGDGSVKFADVTGTNTRMGVWNSSIRGYGFGWDSQNNNTLGTGLVSSNSNGGGYVGLKGQGANPYFALETNNGAIVVCTNAGNSQGRLLLVNGTSALTTTGSAAIGSYQYGVISVRDGATSIAGGSLAFPPTTTAISANTNNLALTATAFQRLNCTSACNLTGIAYPASGTAHADGRMIRLYNVGSANLTLSHNSGSSTAGNKLWCSTAADIILAPNDYAELIYDSTSNGSGSAGWRVK